jgi:hypothetical protein
VLFLVNGFFNWFIVSVLHLPLFCVCAPAAAVGSAGAGAAPASAGSTTTNWCSDTDLLWNLDCLLTGNAINWFEALDCGEIVKEKKLHVDCALVLNGGEHIKEEDKQNAHFCTLDKELQLDLTVRYLACWLVSLPPAMVKWSPAPAAKYEGFMYRFHTHG